MATPTPNLGLIMPDMSDEVDQTIPALASSLGKVDAATGKLSDLATVDKSSLVAAISESSNGIVALKADIAQRAVNVKSLPYNVKGDGVSDDTTALNSLLANSTSRHIYFPEGTYIVEYIHFEKGFHFYGDGFNKTIIKRKNNFNTLTFDTSQPKKANLLGNTMYDYSTKENVSIEGICFDGNVSSAVMSSAATLNMFNNVQLYYLGHLFIKDCKFINSIGDGLFIGGVNNAVIESCYFEHNGYNISASPTTRNAISTFGSYYNNVTSQTILTETNTTVRNCYFNDIHDMAVATRNPKKLTLENNVLGSGASLELYGDDKSTGSRNNTFETVMIIRGNIIGGSVSHGDPNKNFKEVFIFENNYMRNNQLLSIIGNDTSDFDVIVSNNVLDVDKVFISNVNKVKFHHNDVKFVNTTGAFFGRCLFPNISDNDFYYNGVATTNIGLQIYDLATEPIIAKNTFSSLTPSTREGIFFNYSDAVTVRVENMRITENKISGYNRGINIGVLVNNSMIFSSNIIDVPLAGDYAIYQWSGACKTIVCAGNVFPNNITTNLVATNIRIDSKGYGRATIPSGAVITSSVFHGLSYTPTIIVATPKGNVGSVWISSITGSSFKINCSVAPGSDTEVSWRAS